MELTQIHQCLSEPLRVRMVRLLTRGPLCVRHLERILGVGQVSVSKHLSFLKKRGLAVSERRGHWMIYRLVPDRSDSVRTTLDCLERCVASDPLFSADLHALDALTPEIQSLLAPQDKPDTAQPSPPAPPAQPTPSLWDPADTRDYVD
jgi:DNA-binding transcriptional ArsR family regulator